MSALSKFFSLVFFGGFSFISINAVGMTTTNTDELYSESLRLERSSAEVPSSIDSTASAAAAAQEDYVVESMSDMDDAPKAPKAPKKQKKSSKN